LICFISVAVLIFNRENTDMKKIARNMPLNGFIFSLLMGISTMAHSIEEPAYTLLNTIDDVEIRHYAPVIQAVTTLPDNARSGSGFKRLAGFIFGGNDASHKIAMTAPVQETLGSEQPEMAFTMPNTYTLDTLPTPDDEGVRLMEIPERTVAVIKFSGWATNSKINRYTAALTQFIESNNLEPLSGAMLNQYNPPWTPPFMRRNEVMLEIINPATASLPTQEPLIHTAESWSF
jgi:effector-binding domain-containing protein